MSLNKQELFDKLAASIVDMDEDLTIELSNQVITEGIDAYPGFRVTGSAGRKNTAFPVFFLSLPSLIH